MKVVIQRVKNADVKIDEVKVGSINRGLLLLLGIAEGDGLEEADFLARKILNLRIFEDENEKMNLSLLDVNGEILVIPNFTLYADARKGNRPSYTKAANPEAAVNLYKYFKGKLKEQNVKKLEKGEFGANMMVSLINDGPVTIILDTNEICLKNRKNIY